MKRIIRGEKAPIKIWASELETEAEEQLRNVASLPFIHQHVAVMPDAHTGKGSTVGTVLATRGAIIPAAVGVDIGCGMCAVRLPFKVSVFGDSLKKLRHSIERAIPVGFAENREPTSRTAIALQALGSLTETAQKYVDLDKALRQLGSLGGGNHFIEICEDAESQAWVMLHSGSRNIGKCLAEIHIDKAKDLMKSNQVVLPDMNLAYFNEGTFVFDAYLHDLHWAQDYAKQNRNEMMLRILREISIFVFKADKGPQFMSELRVDCHHNYVAKENHFGHDVWVTRKGAVSARTGEFGIIPGSMGAKSYIVEGMGNPESFTSCSHGAGRRMSRNKAKERFTLKDLEFQTQGVECRKDRGVLDEIPGAYKNIDRVMADQVDLVRPVYQLKQLLCIKG